MAYDDEQVIKKNEFVLKGIKGIPGILTEDMYYSYHKLTNRQNILEGGRYRPLSIVSFAIEQQMVGTKHDSVPWHFIWDVNGNGKADPEEDIVKDYVLNSEDFYARGLGLRHFTNVLFFALAIGLIYVFLARYTSIQPDVVFIACILFALHPIHAEVVANIKSRDELFSIFFIFASFIFFFRYYQKLNKQDLILFSLAFFLALMSKEYALLLPGLLFIMLYLFTNESIKVFFKPQFLLATLMFIGLSAIAYFFFQQVMLVLIVVIIYLIVGIKKFKKDSLSLLFWAMAMPFAVYLLLRLNATTGVGNKELFYSNVITNPYLLASPSQIIATKYYVLWKYISLLFYPHPLICDYSFSSIAYRDFASPEVWFSIITYTFIILFLIYTLVKRQIIAFPLLVFIIFLFPVSNLVINIGATMGERLIFHASLGFCLIIAWPVQYILKFNWSNHPIGRFILYSVLFCYTALFFSLTINRNKDWENNTTLSSADYPKAPNNISLINSESGQLNLKAEKTRDTILKVKLLKQSIELIDKGLQLNGAYTSFYETLALDFFSLKEYKNAVSAARAGLKLDSLNFACRAVIESVSIEYNKIGIEEVQKKNYENSISYFNNSIKLNPKNTDAFYNKAVAFKYQGDTLNAVNSIKQGLEIQKRKEFIYLLDELTAKKKSND
jgi:hypothetical protein